jgi:hypothetical protein
MRESSIQRMHPLSEHQKPTCHEQSKASTPASVCMCIEWYQLCLIRARGTGLGGRLNAIIAITQRPRQVPLAAAIFAD